MSDFDNDEQQELSESMESTALHLVRLSQISPEKEREALNYPVSVLVRYSLDELVSDERKALEQLFSENYLLKERMEGVKFLVSTNSLKSVNEYKEYVRKLFLP